MSHIYNIWGAGRTVQVVGDPTRWSPGDPVVYTERSDGKIGFRAPETGDYPDAFIYWADRTSGAPNLASVENITGDFHVHGANGLPHLPVHDELVFWRPDLAKLSVQKGDSGVLAGVILHSDFPVPTVSDTPTLNKVYVVPKSSVSITEKPVASNPEIGDRCYIANPADSGTRLRLTYTRSDGSTASFLISPGKLEAMEWNGTIWEAYTVPSDFVSCECNVSAGWIRDRKPLPAMRFGKGRFLAKSYGNLRSNRGVNGRWVAPNSSPASVVTSNRTLLHIPDPDGRALGVLAEVNSKADFTGSHISRTYALYGAQVNVPCRFKGSGVKYIRLDMDKDDGWPTVELHYQSLTQDNTDWGQDAYLRIWELSPQPVVP